MTTYYTPRDLARDTGQSVRNSRRIFEESGIKHEPGQWWRIDMSQEKERQILDGILRTLAKPESTRHFGCRRRRIEKPKVLQLALF